MAQPMGMTGQGGPRGFAQTGRGRGNAPRGNMQFNPFAPGGAQTGGQAGFQPVKREVPFGAGVPLGQSRLQAPGTFPSAPGVRGPQLGHMQVNQHGNGGLNNLLDSSSLLGSNQLDASADFIDILGGGAGDYQATPGDEYDMGTLVSDDAMLMTPMHSIATGAEDMSMNMSGSMNMSIGTSVSIGMSRQPSRQSSTMSVESSEPRGGAERTSAPSSLPDFNAPVFDWYSTTDFIPGYIPCVPPTH